MNEDKKNKTSATKYDGFDESRKSINGRNQNENLKQLNKKYIDRFLKLLF